MWKMFGGRCIYQSPASVFVHQNLLYRWLTFDSNAIQTLMRRGRPQKPSLNYIKPLLKAVHANPGYCCLLGLGGGAVAHTLLKKPYLSSLLAVESNLGVIDVAKRYFLVGKLKNIEILHQDAALFVKTTAKQFKHLLIDMATANAFPYECSTLDFFLNCRNLLLPEGMLAINLAGLQKENEALFYLKKAFNQKTVILPVKHTENIIVFACNSDSTAPLMDLFGHKHLFWDPMFGYVVRT